MDIEALRSKGIDVDNALRRCGESVDLYGRVLSLFLADRNLEEAIAVSDDFSNDSFFSHLHEIKGMSGNLGLTDLYEASAEAVALFRAQKFDEIGPVFNRVKQAHGHYVEVIKQAGIEEAS